MTKFNAMPILKLARRLTASLLPNSCLLCHHTAGDIVCQHCYQRYLHDRASQRCRRCALRLPGPTEVGLCAACIQAAPAFDQAICAFDYCAPQDQLLQDFKFAGKLALATSFAAYLAQAIQARPTAILPELICAMPLAPERLAQRGYNQAAEIARRLAQSLQIRYQSELVLRSRNTQAQASLNYRARQKNIKAAFTPNLNYLQAIQGRHIAIVDDVMTTGASLNEIATMLKLHGASYVTAYVVARTPLSTHTH